VARISGDRLARLMSAAPARSKPPAVGNRALLGLTAPILVSQFAVMGLALVDTVMAGRLSAQDLAAVALGSSIYASIFIGMNGVLQVLTPIAGHHYGAGRWREIGHTQAQGQWLAIALALFGVAALLTPEPWLDLAGADPAVADITSRYLGWIALALPAALITRVYVGINAAVSRPGVAMAINLALLAAKVPLNVLFLHGAGPLPAMGGAGCAVASAVLLWAGAVLNIMVWRLDPFYQRFRISALTWPAWQRQREILRLGLPSGLSLLIEVTSFTFMAILIARLGAATLAGHHIIANLVSLLFMLPLALGNASSTLVAQRIGAGDMADARRLCWHGLQFSVGLAAVVGAAVFFGRQQVLLLYTDNPAVVAAALPLLAWVALFHTADAVQCVASFVLRAWKVATVPVLIFAGSLWGIGLGGGYVLAFDVLGVSPPALQGAAGYWAASTAGVTVAAAALLGLLVVVMGRERRAAARASPAVKPHR
jgi:MATE family multidrug resistance protein